MGSGTGRAGTAVVIGAGIGGLTAAAALRRRGWRVDVLERAQSLEPVGTGIALAPNAIKALDTLGLAAELDGAAVIQGSGGVRRPSGEWLVRTELGAVERRFGRPLLLLPRARLIELLRSRLPEVAIHLGVPAIEVEHGDTHRIAVVRTQRGELSADLVVAADGIRSATRATLFPTHPGPTYAGFTAWRMIADAPSEPVDPSETWGKGAVFGLVPLAGGRMYCYATANLPEATAFPDEKSALRSRFADWHAPIPAVIESTPAEAIVRNDVHWLDKPLPAYHKGRVALLGDAAHAMTPNLGQGGCQAIEDAVVLVHRLVESDDGDDVDVPAALAAYTAERMPRATRIARQSARTGRMQQMESGFGIALRDAATRVAGKLGPGLMLRQMAALAAWTPPGETENPSTHGSPDDGNA